MEGHPSEICSCEQQIKTLVRKCLILKGMLEFLGISFFFSACGTGTAGEVM